MNLLITGASGFLGPHVVGEALRRGHAVRAVVRGGDASSLGWQPTDNVKIIPLDLRSRAGWPEALQGVDAVLHLAAAKTGDMYAQYAGTVVTTENLLWAMEQANVKRIVAISSMSVYDYLKIRARSVLDEDSPLEEDAFERDAYAHTKLVQERLIRQTCQNKNWACTILRPGVIYGKDNLWTARLGVQASPRWWIRTGAWARVPLTYVENVADAILLCAERDMAIGQTFNVVDDDPPTQRRYMRILQQRLEKPRPRILPISWTIMRSLARMAAWTNKLVFRGRAKIPGIFIPCRLHARCKPLRFSNRRICQTLGWKPRYSLDQSIERITMAEMAQMGDMPYMPYVSILRGNASVHADSSPAGAAR